MDEETQARDVNEGIPHPLDEPPHNEPGHFVHQPEDQAAGDGQDEAEAQGVDSLDAPGSRWVGGWVGGWVGELICSLTYRETGMTQGHVRNCMMAKTEKITPIRVLDAWNFSSMYKGKKGPRQVVTVALQATQVIRKARRRR